MRFLLGAMAIIACLATMVWLARGLAPVKEVTLAAGGQGGGYWQVATRYREILARDGIEVTILETAGSLENVSLLADGSAQVALIQGGIAAPDQTEALSAIFPEPMLLFVKEGSGVSDNPGLWKDLRIAAGGDGSGTRHAADLMFAAAGHGVDQNTLLPLSGQRAAIGLAAGDVDLALFVAPLSAPYLAPLFKDPSITLLQLQHLDALIGRIPQSKRMELPAGAVTLDPLVPAQPTPIVSLTARLVAQETLHPSLVDRLIEAAKEIHNRRDALTREGDFPTLQGVSMPADPYASDLLRKGTSPLQAYLPYWVVAQINRFAILLVPIFLLLLPLLRALPGLYQWRMRARVFRYYQEIRDIDTTLSETSETDLSGLLSRLDEIDTALTALNLPLPYRGNAYTARMHVDLLRRKIEDRIIG